MFNNHYNSDINRKKKKKKKSHFQNWLLSCLLTRFSSGRCSKMHKFVKNASKHNQEINVLNRKDKKKKRKEKVPTILWMASKNLFVPPTSILSQWQRFKTYT